MVKVISLSEEAYRRLKAIKRERSFSELVIELVDDRGKKKKNIMDFFGIWANRKGEIEKMKRMIEGDREKFKLREVKL